MNSVSIITGGAGGMGLATAQVLGRDQSIMICDINSQRLDIALATLKQQGIDAHGVVCDITCRDSIAELFSAAARLGRIGSVVHTAGLSPQMGDADIIMKVNALGTVNVSEKAFEIATDGFALVNLASMAAHLVPRLLMPRRSYTRAGVDPEAFLRRSLFACRFMPKGLYRSGLSYAISKDFVIWYCKKSAARFGAKGARILSVSPGTFDTEMGRLEEKSGSVEMLKKAALKRIGRTQEIADLLAFCAGEKSSYLTGVDILCDGGVVASKV